MRKVGTARQVTVLMVNYRSAEHTRHCLESLDSEEIHRVIVLENGSGEDEWNRLRMVVAPWGNKITLVRSLKNVGFGAGVNLASKQLEPSYEGLIWILNPDTIVHKGCVTSLAEKVLAGCVDVVSPVIATGSQGQPVVWFAGGEFDHRKGATRHLGYGSPLPAPNGVVKTSFMTGAAPMMSFDSWNKLSGFNEDLFLYWEDADLSLRAQHIGLVMGVDTSAHIWHKEGGSGGTEGRSESYYFYMQRNRLIVESIHSSTWNLVVGHGAAETFRLVFRALRERNGKRKKFIASVRGVWSGISTVSARN